MDTESRLDILNLIAAYTHLADSGDVEALAELFAEDGVFIGYGADPTQSLRLSGRSELPAFIEQGRKKGREGGFMSIHFQGPTQFLEVTATTARTRTRALLGHTDLRSPAPLEAGTYTDTFVKVDGQWRIAERIMRRDKSTIASWFSEDGRPLPESS
ncbi:MAG: nuclear transport factor 2 family protein [Dehalococcoidia bacterium]